MLSYIKKKKNAVIIGCGGHSRTVISLLEECGKYFIRGLIDLEPADMTDINGYKILGSLDSSEILPESCVFLAVGNNEKRRQLYDKFMTERRNLPNLCAINSYIDKRTHIGSSNLIATNCYLGSNVEIGDNNIINTGSIIEHESIIGSNTHIAPGSVVAGRVVIGSNCFIGIGSRIGDRVRIGSNVTIGAGSVVLEDLLSPGTYVGAPARKV